MRAFLACTRWSAAPIRRRIGTFVVASVGVTGLATCATSDVDYPFQELLSTDLEGLKKLHSGRVHDVYEVDKNTLLQVATDRLSGFDAVFVNGVPSKGKILGQLSAWWFDHLDHEVGLPHHLLTADVEQMPSEVRRHTEVIRGRCMLVKKLDMLPMEFIVRGYITGSALQAYNKTGKVGGISLPLGLNEGAKLPKPLFGAFKKSPDGHTREDVPFEECVKLLGFSKAAEIATKSLQIYERARRHAHSKGFILANTELEFGIDPKNGALILAGDILTSDSSSFWEASSYKAGRPQESVDRQIVRDYLLSCKSNRAAPVSIPNDIAIAAMNKYVDVFFQLTGRLPVP